MDFSGFGSLMGGAAPAAGQAANPGSAMLALAQKLQGTGGILGGGAPAAPAAPQPGPAVPGDGSMQPTIGPGTATPPAAPYAAKMGLPKGGLLGLLQGGSPQGLAGLLQHVSGGGAGGGLSLAGGMPQAGMLPGSAGQPGSPYAGPVTPPAPQLPTDINPMNQF